MTTPGIGDPYWYEWYVGLEQVIKMLNPDNDIEYVMFQSDIHETIDDVVVGYSDKKEICYQVKHEIGDQGKSNLTFNKLVESTTNSNGKEKVSLIRALALGWKEASKKEEKSILPVLYTNRKLGPNKTTRVFNGRKYSALSLATFMESILEIIKNVGSLDSVQQELEGKDLLIQWEEFKAAIDDDSIVVDFLGELEIKSNEGSLEELEAVMVNSLERTFKCNKAIAKNLFEKLCSKLRIWATTRRENTKITVEDVYDVLSLNHDVEHGEHELPYPTPFFKSREAYAEEIIKIVEDEERKVVWVSGNPGSGKTSLISYLQLKHNLFTARYHTFKPISPEQKYYNNDAGLCSKESLWNDLLIQLRKKLKGNLHRYSIPVINALCTVEQMRHEVMRLSEVLYELTGTKTVICIDGIDHAARANNEVTFLSDLFRPEEIRKGVVFIIVGQPAEFYESYPLWLKKETDSVKHCIVPNLERDDIEKLLDESEINYNIQNEILAEFVYEKTQGNNLSVVFAIEEAKQCSTLEEYKKILDSKHVSDDITNYYSYIWKFVADFLNSKSLGINFSDKLLASLIILLNGRLDTEVLKEAIQIGLMKEDWEELLELLFPLIQKVNANEYALFHNDFRVFLTSKNSEGPKFKAIALQLAQYYISVGLNHDSLINTIPLLMSADRRDMIPSVFNTDYIVHSLANGISKKTLEEQTILAYKAVLESREWKDFHSVYLAVFTLSQHQRYFEHYDKKYNTLDKSYVKKLSPFELRPVEVNTQNIEKYRDMFKFCLDLLYLKDPVSKVRAVSTYNLWTKNCTPIDFVNLIENDKNLYDRYVMEQTLKFWGILAAKLNNEYIKLRDDLDFEKFTNQQLNLLVTFNDSYFNYCIEQSESIKALEVVNEGGVTLTTIKENLQDLLLNKKSTEYIEMIEEMTKKNDLLKGDLLEYVCLIFNEREIPYVDISSIEKINYIIDDTNLKMVIIAMIAGYQSVHKDLLVELNKVNELITNIDRKDREYDYLKILMRHSFILGRIISEGRLGINGTVQQSVLIKSYEDFLEYGRQHNSFNSRDSLKILLFISLNQNRLLNTLDNQILIPFLENHLFEVKQLGMFYKSIILDYLVEDNSLGIVKNYLIELYGEDGQNLFKEGNFEETHNNFGGYLKIINPSLYLEITNKLKWDVVGYSDHKEYALWPLVQYFEKMVEINNNEWKNRGLALYKISSIVESKGSNRAFSEIQSQISKAAAKDNIQDVWELRCVDEDYRFSLDLIYEELLILFENINDVQDLKLGWMFGCSILSWYNSEDRIKLGNLYNTLISKGKELGIETIEAILNEISPQHVKIALKSEKKSYSSSSEWDYNIRLDEENKEITDIFSNLTADEIVNFLKTNRSSMFRWKSLEIAWDIIESRKELNSKMVTQIKNVTLSKLETYSWENSGSEKIIKKLLPMLNEELLWELAKYNLINFSVGDDYYTFKSNMQFIISLLVGEVSKEYVFDIFDEELKCHEKWITGCNHINFEYELATQNCQLPKPNNFLEYTINILLEQITTRNIHRIETALFGFDLLVRYSSKTFNYLSKVWNVLHSEQKQFVIFMMEKWSEENLQDIEALYPQLYAEFFNTNELDKKIHLYFILLKRYDASELECFDIKEHAVPIEYHRNNNVPKVFDKSKISISASRFLSAMEMLNGISNDDIGYYIKINKEKEKEKEKERHKRRGSHVRDGDSLLYPSSYSELDMKILYGEEVGKRWNNIPIGYKAQTLLNMDDPWVISRVPIVSHDPEWSIEEKLSSYIEEGQLLKCKPYLKKLLYKDTQDEMLVIGGAIWFPIKEKEGIIYLESSKVISKDILIKGYDIKKAINSRSFIINGFDSMTEMFELEDEYLNGQGVSLVNEIIGTSIFVYGNTMLYPSAFIIEMLELKPINGDSLRWGNSKGEEVLYFESYTNPTRDTNREHYYRQPIMGRWLGKKTLIEQLLTDLNLNIFCAEKVEPMNDRYI